VQCADDEVQIMAQTFNAEINQFRTLPVCLACPTGCATCILQDSIPGAFSCQTCTDTYFLIKDMCVPTAGSFLPEYWYDDVVGNYSNK
jgi:hypothetical protein